MIYQEILDESWFFAQFIILLKKFQLKSLLYQWALFRHSFAYTWLGSKQLIFWRVFC